MQIPKTRITTLAETSTNHAKHYPKPFFCHLEEMYLLQSQGSLGSGFRRELPGLSMLWQWQEEPIPGLSETSRFFPLFPFTGSRTNRQGYLYP